MSFPKLGQYRRAAGVTLFVLGLLFSIMACGLLVRHTSSFTLKRDTAVMIGTTLPELTSSVALLTANRQAEQIFAEKALASREEQAQAYILPKGPSSARAVQSLQTIAHALTAHGTAVTVGSITFEPAVNHGSYLSAVSHVTLTGTFQAVARFLSILSYSGKLMVRDVLGEEAADQFLRQVEAASPLALTNIERFLYLDLIQYAAHPDSAEQEIFQDMPTELQGSLRAFVLQAGLAALRTTLQDIAGDLRDTNVWPLPLVSVASMTRDGEKWNVDLVFYRR